MKIRKIIITAVVSLAVIIGVVAGWFIGSDRKSPAPPDSDHLDWVWVSETVWKGALSEQGYYYGSQILSYCDFATEQHAVLCGKAGCKHEGEECDAYTGSAFGTNMFFGDGYLYYLQHSYDGQHLYRRDATGAAMVSIGTPGQHYIKQQKSVDIDHLTLADGYLFYRGRVGTDTGTTVTLDIEFIARMNLATGKEEILVEVQMESPGDHLRLCAVRGSGVIYSRYVTPTIDLDDPDRLDAVKQTPHTLYLWSEATGESAVLLEKTIEKFSQVRGVSGGKVFYSTLTTPDSADLYAYDLATGKDEHWISGRMWHLGGGYSLRQQEDGEGYDLINLLTKKTLPNALNEISNGGVGYIRCASDKGLIIQWYGEELRKENEGDEYGYRDQHHDYITYVSLADGLQKEDLIPILADEILSSSVEAPDTTTPTETTPATPSTPNRPADSTKKPVEFFTEPPIPDEEITKIIQYLPKVVDNPKNLPVLKWVCLKDNYSVVTFTEDAVIDLNRMLETKNMPFRLQIVFVTYEADPGQRSLYSELDWFSSPEIQDILKDADLIYAPMDPEERKAHLLPITEYATGDAQPSLKNSVLHELNWLSASCDGEIYGIPSDFSNSLTTGWVVETGIMEKLNLTVDDFNREFWEMDDLLAKIYEANGKKAFLELHTSASFTPTDLRYAGGISDSLPTSYQGIGAFFAIDHAADKPTVVNLLELDTLRDIRDAVARYQAAGYTLTQHNDYDYSAVKVYHGSVSCDIPVAVDRMLRIPTSVSTYYTSYAETKTMTGIAASTGHKEEALTLLNLIAEDEAFRNLLLFGKKGRDYEIIDGALSLIQEVTTEEIVEVETHADGTKSTLKYRYDLYTRYGLSFLSGLSEYGTLTNEMQYGYPTVAGKTKQQTYLETMERIAYIHYPIQFDFTGFEDELEQIGQLLGSYWYNLMNASSVDDEAFDQLLLDIEAAGGERIRAELQRQLDAWLAENPGWQ